MAELASSPDRAVVAKLVVVGALTGFLAGLFGIGGGILVVPALVMLLGMDQRLAHGTSLAAVLPISVASVVTYASQGNVDWALAAPLAVGSVAGVLMGTAYLRVARVRTLQVMFAVLLVVSAVRLFVPVDADGRSSLSMLGIVVAVVVGLASGTLAGLLGIGGGVVVVPALILGFGLFPVVAKGISVAAIIPAALVGTARNRTNRNADLRAAVIIGAAGVLTAVLGGIVSDQLDDDVAIVLFAVLLLVIAGRVIFQLRRPPPVGHPAP